MNKLPISLLIAGAGCVACASENAKPNLLIIHTDEHSYRTLSCYQKQLPEDQAFVWGKGCNVETPNIDRIADQGAICMKYYCSSPVSTPSRGTMMTGRYPKGSGAWKNDIPIDETVPTFASILADNGYSTSYVGKWHLAGENREKYQFGIEYNGGFADNRYMMTGGHAPYFILGKDGEVMLDKDHVAKGVNETVALKSKNGYIHLTDFFTNKALEIIERDKDKPFCLMLSIPDPHTPDYARPPYKTMYDDMNPTMPLTMKPEYVSRRPEWANVPGNDAKTPFDAPALRQYFGMVKHIDDSVGLLLASLEQKGILDNTIVIFTSDHGDLFFEHSRRNKDMPYETSAGIPFVIRYPAKIHAGKVIDKAYVNCDFAPTVLGLMGIKTDVKFVGEDTSADFIGAEQPKEIDRMVHFAEYGNTWAAEATRRYKLVASDREEPYLFDLEVDPNEIENFYNKPGYEKISKQMMEQLKRDVVDYQTPVAGTGAPEAHLRYQ